jgi:hypothetical protein
MPASSLDLDALLAYRDSHAPWFYVQADLPYPQLKRHLKLLLRLSGALSPTLDELDALTGSCGRTDKKWDFKLNRLYWALG